MRIYGKLNDCIATLSCADTEAWAHRPGNAWPCSTLSGHRIRVEVDGGDLTGFTIDGRDGDCDGAELDAILSDFGIRR
jgi:hypothetical protein